MSIKYPISNISPEEAAADKASTVSPQGKTWKVGALTYTTAGLAVLFCWLLWGDFAFSMRDRSVPNIMQLLFKRYGASLMLTGLLSSSLVSGLSLIIGPIVGYHSDRTRTRWGRRIPFLIMPTPFIVASMVALAFSPQLGVFLHQLLGSYSPGRDSSVLIILGIFWTVFEISCITAGSVFGALVNDVVPQAVIGRFYGLFRVVSLIAGIIFSHWLFGKSETHFLWLFLGLAALYGGGFTIMCLNVKEGKYPPPPSEATAGAGGFLSGIRTYFKDGFGHSYYLWYFAAAVLGNLALNPFNMYSIFYGKSFGMTTDDFGQCLAITFSGSLILAYPLGALADRFHPIRISILGLILYAVTMAAAILWVRDSKSFSIALIAHGILSGTLYTSWASLGQRLLPRLKFAEINSAGIALSSLSMMLLAPTVGAFLDFTNQAYRYTFYANLLITLLALGAFLVLHSKFMALGGPKNYVAPE